MPSSTLMGRVGRGWILRSCECGESGSRELLSGIDVLL